MEIWVFFTSQSNLFVFFQEDSSDAWLAKTVAQRPKLVLADEFLGELDDDNVEVVMRTVRSAIEAQNSAMIMVEHHEELARQVANPVWRINDGRLVEEVVR